MAAYASEDSGSELSLRSKHRRAFVANGGVPASGSVSESTADADDHARGNDISYGEESEAESDGQAWDEKPWGGSVGATRPRAMLVNDLRASGVGLSFEASEASEKSRRTSETPAAESLRQRAAFPRSRKTSENWEVVDITTPSLQESTSEGSLLQPEAQAPESHQRASRPAQIARIPSSPRSPFARLSNPWATSIPDPPASRRTSQPEGDLPSSANVSMTSEPSVVQRRRMALINELDQPFFSVGYNDRRPANLSMDSSDWDGVEGMAISGSGAWGVEQGIVRADDLEEQDGDEHGWEEEGGHCVRQLSKVSEERMSEESGDEDDQVDVLSASEYSEEDEEEHQAHDRSFDLETDDEGIEYTPRPNSKYISEVFRRRSDLAQNTEDEDFTTPSRSASVASSLRGHHPRMPSRTASDSDLSDYGDPSSPPFTTCYRQTTLPRLHQRELTLRHFSTTEATRTTPPPADLLQRQYLAF